MPFPKIVDDWKATVVDHQKKLVIPEEWRLDPEYLKDVSQDSTISVLEIPIKSGILSDLDIEITGTPASMILQKLAKGELTSYQVTLSFCKRAAIAHQLTNCLADFFPNEALELAKELDLKFQGGSVDDKLGRLHGLPISFKEIFNIKGHETTNAFASYIGNVKTEDGLVTKCIRAAGGVPFCKTNIAQGCLIVEGLNNVFGTTLNPSNLSLTPAGSSSGEGALVKMKGSPLGIGTDGGGSVRLPAHSNGVFGFMPSTNRITSEGTFEGQGALTWVQSQIGPLTNDVEMIEIWAKAMLDYNMELHDPFTYGVPWKDIELPTTLNIGVLYQDNVVQTTPAMLRVLEETIFKLKSIGHNIIEIDVGQLHRDLTETVFQMYVSSGLDGYKSAIKASNEPFIPRCCGSEVKSAMTLEQVYKLDSRARKLGQTYLQTIFTKNELHVLLTPSSPNPAAPHGKYSTNSLSAVYNCLGYAAGIVPIGVFDVDKDQPNEKYLKSQLLPDIDVQDVFPYDYYDKYVKTELYTDVKKFTNAPLSVQVVGGKHNDEMVVEVMKLISKYT